MAQYQTRASKLAKSSYRYTHKISATETQYVDLPNGSTVEKPVEIWSRSAALYGTSLKSTQTIEGYSGKTDVQFAVHSIQNDPFSKFDFDTSMIIQVDGNKNVKYYVKNIARDTGIGYHVITLTTNNETSSSSY